MNIVIGISAAAVGAIAGFGGALAFRATKYGQMKKQTHAHQIALNAFAQAYRDILSDGWQNKIYRRVSQILQENGEKVYCRVVVTTK